MGNNNIGGILLTEVNRIREMMGMRLITEGIDDLVANLLRMSDEGSTAVAKSADEAGSEFNTALSKIVGGAGTYDDLISYVSKQGGSVKTVDDIATYIRSKPDLLRTIALSSDVIMKRGAEDLFANANVKSLFDPTSWNIVNKSLKSENPNIVNSTLKQLEQYRGKNKELDELIKKLEDRKSIAENMRSISSSKVVDDIDGGSSRSLDDEFINDPKIKNVTDNQKSKIESDISSMSEQEVKTILDEIKNKNGKFSSGTLSANGLTKEQIEKFGGMVGSILLMPLNLVTRILKTLGFNVQVSPVKAYLSLALLSLIGYTTYKWYNGEFSLSQALPKIDTSDENCVQNVVGYDTLTKDMKNFVAIQFGCRKTKDIDANSTEKITGFGNVTTNQISVIYSNANCNKIYEISAGGMGELIGDTCSGSTSGGGEEETTTPDVGEEGALDEL